MVLLARIVSAVTLLGLVGGCGADHRPTIVRRVVTVPGTPPVPPAPPDFGPYRFVRAPAALVWRTSDNTPAITVIARLNAPLGRGGDGYLLGEFRANDRAFSEEPLETVSTGRDGFCYAETLEGGLTGSLARPRVGMKVLLTLTI